MSPLSFKMRAALVTWMVVYPLITVLLGALEPFLAGLPLPLRTLLVTAIMVPVMVLWAMPAAQRRLEHFLNSAKTTKGCTP